MKRILLLSVCSLSVLFLGNCHGDINSVEVIIDNGGEFPSFLVGTWKANNGGWEIVFEKDGTISSAVISLGLVRMIPGQTTTIPMKLGGKGVFQPGIWTVQYLQEQRELIVEIVIDNFHTELGDDTVQGRTRDFFIGPVSQDGTLWWVERYTFPEYIVDTEIYHNYKLPFDPNENPWESLIFEKITE
jgi:hypothetical protein